MLAYLLRFKQICNHHDRRLTESDLEAIFGIEIAPAPGVEAAVRRGRRKSAAVPSGPTGAGSRRLRERFDMTPAQLAAILGVSTSTVVRWERTPGPVRLRARALEAWDAVSRLSRREAWSRYWATLG